MTMPINERKILGKDHFSNILVTFAVENKNFVNFKKMISFESDYSNGTLPEILEALGKTNDEKTSGYRFDPYTEAAK